MSDTMKTIKGDIQALKYINDFVISNEEMAANNMRKIRNAVVSRRDFVAEITQLYNDVKACYKKELSDFLSGKKHKNTELFKLIKKNDKNVYVLLSTNTSLFGDIVRNTFNLLKEHETNGKGDIVIVGKMGKKIFEAERPGASFKYFDFPDTYLDYQLLKTIALHIIQYSKVVIFHSKFQTLLRQTPTAYTIAELTKESGGGAGQIKYIFEPSIEKIIEFFEKEIFTSIFEQTMHESQLSKFAARMVTLDRTMLNVKKGLVTLNKKRRVVQHELMNKQQINVVSRMIAWNRDR